MHLNLSDLSANQAYHTLTQTLIPRPVAWVLSDSGNDSLNLAPFSYFNAVCSDPPLVMISIGKKPDGSQKDTCCNIEERRDFIIHIASIDQLDALNQSSLTLPHGDSELKLVDVELDQIEGSRLPIISGSPIAYICNHHDTQEIDNSGQKLIFGEVMAVHIDDRVCTQDDAGRLKIIAKKVNPLLRLGAGEYGTLGEVIARKRPA
jgi:flavin reductase (DIM6/NTAB) family NADH-FMN oxidoreductase RutF